MFGPKHLLGSAKFWTLAVVLSCGFASRSYSQISDQERQALIALYNGTNGAGWVISDNWLGSPGTECTWFGVQCDTGQTTIVQINLAGNYLSGPIPAELGNLTNLERLVLAGNHLSGPIPAALGNLANLQFLDLAVSGLSGPIPAALGNLTNLQSLDLRFNQLSGPIPAALGNLTNLQSLDLTYNQLSGPIPAALGNLANLQSLDLQRTDLSGPIPAELGNLANLQSLDLTWNQLSGPIPAALGNLTNLQSLDLSSNQLSGPIPAELGNLANLQGLYLDDNQLSGPIPAALGNLANLQSLDLSSNQLSAIPAELGNLANLQTLYLSSNQLSAISAELGNLANLQWLDLSSNQLSAIPAELGNLANLQTLYLSSNQLSAISAELGNLANLQSLDLSSNQLSAIPAALGNLANLQSLDLSSNQLSAIPAALGNLTNLQGLSLSSNQLSGPIPAELGNLTNLQSLDLRFNQLSGPIPAELGNLTNLQSLDLRFNQLSGPIPAELGNLANLRSLFLSSNQLSGPIPAELANLTLLGHDRGNPFPKVSLSYNALYTNDATLRAFLNSKQPDWQDTQTIMPVGVTATAQSSSSIQVSWIPIAYSADPGGYEVFYSVTPGGPFSNNGWITATKTASSLLVASLSPNTTYYFVVRTITEPHANNQNTVQSGFSSEVAGTTARFPSEPSVITANDPSSILEGAPSFSLTVSGSGFQSEAIVRWNGSARTTTVVSSNQLKALISTSDVLRPGTAQVTVVQNDWISNALPFTILADIAPAVITQVLPISGSTLGNTRVTIVGNHFKPELATAGATSPLREVGKGAVHRQSPGEGVFFGGVQVTEVVFVNRTQLEAITPVNPAGSTEVSVGQANGTASLPDGYEYRVLPPVPELPVGGKRQQVPYVVDSGAFRTNLGINNLGETAATAEVLLVDANGLLVASKAVQVPGHGMKQLNHVLRELEGATGLTGREGYLILDYSSPAMGSWASQIDNKSLDPSMELGRGETGAASRVVLLSSVSSSRFLTSLIVINASGHAGTVTIRVRDPGGQIRTSLPNQPLPARGYFYFLDFYQTLGMREVFGPIEVEGEGGIQILASERIYTRENTSGYVEGVDMGQAGRTIVLPYAVDTEEFRTNLGINNVGERMANVVVSLLDGEGQVQGSLNTTVPPHGLTQINHVIQQVMKSGGVTGREGLLRLESDEPILGWTSQIDNVTQDPSLVMGKGSSGAARLLIPSTTNFGNFKSTLAVVNLATAATTVQLRARDPEGGERATANVTIAGLGLLSYSDILTSMGLQDSYGPLEILSLDKHPLLAVSRVYSNQRTAGYFEGLAAE